MKAFQQLLLKDRQVLQVVTGYYTSIYLRQGAVTYILPVKTFATRIKKELEATKINRQDTKA